MGLSIQIQITGDKQVMAKLKKLGKGLNDMKSAMEGIGKQAVKYYSNEAFNSKGGVYGEKWPELNSTYAARKRKIWGRSKPILVASGDMRDSFYYEAEKSQVTVGNTADYFKFHQSNRPRRVLPRRKMIGVNEKIRRIVRDEIRSDVREKLSKV